MDNNDKILYPIKDEHGEICGIFALSTIGEPIIVDYSLINRNLIASKDKTFTLGAEKKKEVIPSICGLQRVLEELTKCVRTAIINDSISALQFSLPPEDTNLINQLVFDILYNKYLDELPQITLYDYCYSGDYICYDWIRTNVEDAEDGLATAKNTAYNMMKREVKHEIEIYNNPGQKLDIAKLGYAPDSYLKVLNIIYEDYNINKRKAKKKVSKSLLDYFFYNGNSKLLTYKQFRRRFWSGDNSKRNTSHERFITAFDNYDRFVQTTILKEGVTKEEDKNKDYFLRSMNFYHLEIYKRLDFIYQLAKKTESEDLTNYLESNPLLVERFAPEVLHLYIDNKNKLRLAEKNKYYRPHKPLIFLDELWEESQYHYSRMYYYIRAIVVELFNYNYKYDSNDYSDISKFISTHYNILSYHEVNKKWKKGQRYLRTRIHNAQMINDTLFWESDKRIPVELGNPNR